MTQLCLCAWTTDGVGNWLSGMNQWPFWFRVLYGVILSYIPFESEDGEEERDLIFPDALPLESLTNDGDAQAQISFVAPLGNVQANDPVGSLGERPYLASLARILCVLVWTYPIHNTLPPVIIR